MTKEEILLNIIGVESRLSVCNPSYLTIWNDDIFKAMKTFADQETKNLREALENIVNHKTGYGDVTWADDYNELIEIATEALNKK